MNAIWAPTGILLTLLTLLSYVLARAALYIVSGLAAVMALFVLISVLSEWRSPRAIRSRRVSSDSN